jgi:hypothetical protein
MEAVAVPETFERCTKLIRLGGRVTDVGVRGHPVEPIMLTRFERRADASRVTRPRRMNGSPPSLDLGGGRVSLFRGNEHSPSGAILGPVFVGGPLGRNRI